MSKIFKFSSNENLVLEAEELLLRNPTTVSEKWDYYNALDEMQKKISKFKEETFSQIDEYLSTDNKYCLKSVEIIFDAKIENAMDKLFEKKQKIFSRK